MKLASIKKNLMGTKTKLTELGSSKSHEKATPGNYRACVMIDSCVYQIGEDTPDRDLAHFYCSEYSDEMQPVQIFDDKGEEHIIDGKLKKIIKIYHEEKDLPNAPCIIVAVMKNGEKKPYYVKKIAKGGMTGATMLLGEYLEDIVNTPAKILNLDPESTLHERLYIQNEKEKGKDKDIQHYQEFLPEDMEIWKQKFHPILIGQNVFENELQLLNQKIEKANQLVGDVCGLLFPPQ